ncbi:MAG: hypothetical protein KKA73_28065 [Chloroflexi bacterium]|nr:hypothetical protein [Chloroflexota bacterium]MBU1751551.1 hypothetical protein [Chloroflexota bacterium]
MLTAPANLGTGLWTEPTLTVSPEARYGHSMVLAGRTGTPYVYVFGGRSNASAQAQSDDVPQDRFFQNLWKLLGDQDKWDEMVVADPPLARYLAESTCVNGYIYTMLGQDSEGNYLFDVWKYDDENFQWVKLEDAVDMGARARAAAAVMQGKIYVSGGQNESGALDDLWSFNPVNQDWTPLADMPRAVVGHTMVANNDHLYVYGVTSTTLRYNPYDDVWEEQKPANDPPPDRVNHVAVSVWERGSMFVFGGQDRDGAPLADIWEYHFTSNSWTYQGEMPIWLTQSAAAVIPPDTDPTESALPGSQYSRIVLFGGLSAGGPTNRTFVYYPTPPFSSYLPLMIKP